MKSSKKKKGYFLLSIEKDFREELKKEAIVRGYTMTNFIIKCLKEKLEKVKKKNEKELTESNEGI